MKYSGRTISSACPIHREEHHHGQQTQLGGEIAFCVQARHPSMMGDLHAPRLWWMVGDQA